MFSTRTSERIVAASGALFVVGAVVGFGVLVGSVPGPGAEAEEVRTFLDRSDVRVWTGGYVGLLAQLAFLVFAAGLWSMLRAAEGGTGWVSTCGFAAAVLLIGVTIAGDLAPGAAVFRVGSTVDPTTAALLLEMKKVTETITGPLIGVFLAAAALVSLRATVLPRWASWSAAVIAGVSLVTAPLGYEASQTPHFLALLWILVVSVRLLARPLPSPSGHAPAQAA